MSISFSECSKLNTKNLMYITKEILYPFEKDLLKPPLNLLLPMLGAATIGNSFPLPKHNETTN
ncbi:hypothetical protein [Bacillus cereus group sp. Sample30]|uniref:hypothetical protein n=1 Tax=Bacillus cereus group sp. Sample30 TaxID=2816449 RepID=UPI0009CF8519|nr:hypothetical protein BKK45_04395 [Bacillus cereus]